VTLYTSTVATCGLEELRVRRYDALLCSLGYESRAVAVARSLDEATRITAVGFPYGHDDVYRANGRTLERLQADVVSDLSSANNAGWVVGWLAEQARLGARRVAVDISSTTRTRIATAVHAMLHERAGLVVDFLYVPERYLPAPPIPAATESAGPITSFFAGWAPDARQPLGVLFGLGYEPTRAAGALDYLEPTTAIPLLPTGGDPAFAADVRRGNEDVFAMRTVRDAVEYDIADPAATISILRGLAEQFARSHPHEGREPHRVLLLPFGPKVFALSCLVMSATSPVRLPVWRVSPGRFEGASDRVAEDRVITLRTSTTALNDLDVD
jgi:hypothetical protein